VTIEKVATTTSCSFQVEIFITSKATLKTTTDIDGKFAIQRYRDKNIIFFALNKYLF